MFIAIELYKIGLCSNYCLQKVFLYSVNVWSKNTLITGGLSGARVGQGWDNQIVRREFF